MGYADPVTDNLLAGFNAGDYVKFSRDFDAQMKNALTEAVFKQTRQQIISKTGLYQSRTLAAIQQQGADMVVVYNGTFAGENNSRLPSKKSGDRNSCPGCILTLPS